MLTIRCITLFAKLWHCLYDELTHSRSGREHEDSGFSGSGVSFYLSAPQTHCQIYHETAACLVHRRSFLGIFAPTVMVAYCSALSTTT